MTEGMDSCIKSNIVFFLGMRGWFLCNDVHKGKNFEPCLLELGWVGHIFDKTSPFMKTIAGSRRTEGTRIHVLVRGRRRKRQMEWSNRNEKDSLRGYLPSLLAKKVQQKERLALRPSMVSQHIPGRQQSMPLWALSFHNPRPLSLCFADPLCQ